MATKPKLIRDAFCKIETRKAENGLKYLDGLIPFNSRSEVMWDFVEVIDPMAFNKTLADGANVYAFWAHDDAEVLASRDAGTLKLETRAEGLHFSIEMRTDSADKFAAVERGDVVGVSFGFIAQKEEWDFKVEPAVRTLKEVQLLEISPGVAFPAYPGAQSSASLRSLALEIPRLTEIRSKIKQLVLDGTQEQRMALKSSGQDEEAIKEKETLARNQEATLALIKARFGLHPQQEGVMK